jgi:predicted nucleic acid-binding protein
VWRRLVGEHRVKGVKANDARLAAAMELRGVTRILTFDAGDFTRYGLTVLDPAISGGISD